MYQLIKKDGRARRGQFTTPHGVIQTPVFMNVATQAAIKGGLAAEDLSVVGCQVSLSNTYHLHVRPGEEIVRGAGGLHRFMGWNGPILTDSGGFQVFSLAQLRNIGEEGVSFASHVNGQRIFIGPEQSVRIQAALGSDIAMAFDECVANPSPYDYVARSLERTTRWLVRCSDELQRIKAEGLAVNPGQMLFGINQGGTYETLRIEHMQQIAELDLPGYAVGGLAVGEPAEIMYRIIDAVEPFMPAHRPRYLMGVGTPGNILEAAALGIDFFDCVLPARNARHGHLQTAEGRINLHNEKYARDYGPIDDRCGCPVCQSHSRAYIRHLLKAGEVLGLRLCVLHNLFFYNTLMQKIRDAIERDEFEAFRGSFAAVLDRRI